MVTELPCCPHPQPVTKDLLSVNITKKKGCPSHQLLNGRSMVSFLGGADHQHFSPLTQLCATKPAIESTSLIHSAASQTGWDGPLSKTCCQFQNSGSDILPRERGRPQKQRAPSLNLTSEREWGRSSLRIFLKTVEALVITRRQVTPWEQVGSYRPASLTERFKERSN